VSITSPVSNKMHLIQPELVLKRSVQTWFVVAVLGQVIFASYIVLFYWLTVLSGDTHRWTEVLPNGMIDGDTPGNLVLATHVVLAAIVTLGGPLQFIRKIRNSAPRFHHWNGRVYLATAVIMSVSGLVIVWTRGTVGDMVQQLGISLNAVLILLFAVLAVRNAIKRNIIAHRRWALRLFVVVSGVWFFRVGLMFWLTVNQGPVGIDFETFTGPFLYFLAFANYLLPLAVLELYLYAQRSSANIICWAASAVLFIAALAMLVGIIAATVGMWMPHM